jgi:hypothetical protein
MDTISLLFSFFVLTSTALFATVMSLVPATGYSIMPAPKRKYYTIKVSRTLVKHVEVEEFVDAGYEKGTFNTPAILARFNPFLNATFEEIEAWNEVTFEDSCSYWNEKTITLDVAYGVRKDFSDVYEVVDMNEAVLAPNVLAALNEYYTPVVRSPKEIIAEMQALLIAEHNTLVQESLMLVVEANVLLPKTTKTSKKAKGSAKPAVKQTKGKKPYNNVAGPDVFRNVVQNGGSNSTDIHAK